MTKEGSSEEVAFEVRLKRGGEEKAAEKPGNQHSRQREEKHKCDYAKCIMQA